MKMKQTGAVFLGALAILWVVSAVGIFGTAAVVSHNNDTAQVATE